MYKQLGRIKNKGNNKIIELRAIFQRERQNSLVNKQKKSFMADSSKCVSYVVCKIWFNPPFLWKCLYQVRAIAVFLFFRLWNDFFCLLTNEFCLSLWKIFTDDIGHTFWGVGHNNWTIIVRKDMDVNAPENLFNFPLRYNLK
jgi:hypothetical protein